MPGGWLRLDAREASLGVGVGVGVGVDDPPVLCLYLSVLPGRQRET